MSSRPRPSRGARRFLKRVLVAVLLSAVLVAIIAYVAITRYALVAPTWWQPPSATDPQTLEAARAVENGVTTLLHQQHASDQTWTMSLSSTDANAWLVTRLKEWVANQDGSFAWPSELSSLQLDFRDGQMVFGVGVVYHGGVRVLSLSIVPRIDEAGALWIPASNFAIGKLTLPASLADSILRSYLPGASAANENTSKVFDALSGKKPISTKPILKLSDGRRVTILRIRSEKGRLLVTCQPAPAAE